MEREIQYIVESPGRVYRDVFTNNGRNNNNINDYYYKVAILETYD
jgi:hypothetical protein